MASKLISLRHVPDEEASGIRALLEQYHIGYYETPASRWGISAAVIWLEDSEQLAQVQNLLDTFQKNYAQNQREAYQQRLSAGLEPGFLDRLKAQPVQVTGLLLAILIIAWFSITPFLLADN